MDDVYTSAPTGYTGLTQPFTFSYWAKVDASLSVNSTILSWAYLYGGAKTDGNMDWTFSGGTFLSAAYTDDVWQHWCMVVRSDLTSELWRDGVSVDTDTASNSYTGSFPVQISHATSSFNGALDEISFWDVAFTDEEVEALADGPLDLLTESRYGDLTHYYRMGEDALDSPQS